VQVVHVDRIAGDVEAQVIGLAVHVAGLHSAAGNPNRGPIRRGRAVKC
jgi:hypothetical protein